MTKAAVEADRGYNSDWRLSIGTRPGCALVLPRAGVLLYNKDEISYFQGYHYVNQIFSG
ncbi:hypothetical protein [Cupriavidus sp. H39]|uniref:hypothetical protein n=1 Tax=Cupriavidus sp. H39 TaxID=3401635 RepID=UPI003D084205